MKNILLFILLTFYTTISNAQRFDWDTALIIKNELIFDTSKTIQNEDLFVVENLAIMNGCTSPDYYRYVYTMPVFLKIIVKKKSNILLEKVKINNLVFSIDSVFKKYEKYDPLLILFNEMQTVELFKKEQNKQFGRKAKTKIDLYYTINKKHKHFVVNEVKVEWQLLLWNYIKGRHCQWQLQHHIKCDYS